MTRPYTFCVSGTHKFETVNGDTREEALHDAAYLLNADEADLIELPTLEGQDVEMDIPGLGTIVLQDWVI